MTTAAIEVGKNLTPIPAPRKAEKRRVKLKLAVQGPSGSGKTWGALSLAKNLWPNGKVLVIDTENESASLYADRFEFDTIPLNPPFESARYEACIDYAVRSGYDVLICDSISQQWDGEGGILRRKEELDRRPGSNSFANWSTFTPEHTHFIESIKQAPIHIIATMRSKQEYALETNDKGKSKPVKLGMAPIQRDGFDYEFTLVFDVQMDHKAVVIKNRTGLFGDKPVDLASQKIADALSEWLDSGKPVEVAVPVVEAPPAPVAAKPTQKVDEWNLESDKLTCFIYDAQKRTSKKGAEFVVVKHNGQVNGKDAAFCFHDKLFDILLSAKGKKAVLFIDSGDYVNVADVVSIDGVEYRDGVIYKTEPKQQTFVATDDDIPF